LGRFQGKLKLGDAYFVFEDQAGPGVLDQFQRKLPTQLPSQLSRYLSLSFLGMLNYPPGKFPMSLKEFSR
jgi:hypothetical protein